MLLNDLFESLSYGPLSNLSIGGEGSGTIPVASQPRLTHLANLAILGIYKKFSILEKEVILQANAGQTVYPLEKQYAESDPTEVDHKFILDTVDDPFEEDVLKILGIYDELGTELPLNDADDEESLFLPGQTIVQIPKPVTGNIYYVLYQAKPPLLDTRAEVDLTQEIPLPDVLYAPLVSNIAYRVMSPMAGQEATAKAQEHLATYNSLCDEVEFRDLARTSLVTTSHKFHKRGFK